MQLQLYSQPCLTKLVLTHAHTYIHVYVHPYIHTGELWRPFQLASVFSTCFHIQVQYMCGVFSYINRVCV